MNIMPISSINNSTNPSSKTNWQGDKEKVENNIRI